MSNYIINQTNVSFRVLYIIKRAQNEGSGRKRDRYLALRDSPSGNKVRVKVYNCRGRNVYTNSKVVVLLVYR